MTELFTQPVVPQLEIPPHVQMLAGRPVRIHHADQILLGRVAFNGSERIALTIARAGADDETFGGGLLLTPDPALARDMAAWLLAQADAAERTAAAAGDALLASAARARVADPPAIPHGAPWPIRFGHWLDRHFDKIGLAVALFLIATIVQGFVRAWLAGRP